MPDPAESEVRRVYEEKTARYQSRDVGDRCRFFLFVLSDDVTPLAAVITRGARPIRTRDRAAFFGLLAERVPQPEPGTYYRLPSRT